ncbi:hypothetical protein E4U41_002771, partial [Claviceps citrina]
MAALPWESIRSLLICFAPFLLPKAISWYRSLRASTTSHGLPIQPTPPGVRLGLGLLFALSAVYLVQTLPPFAPENLFLGTQSRLQIPVDVLFSRVSTLLRRGGNSSSSNEDNSNSNYIHALTRSDLALRAKFVNLESRLLYLQFGPAVLADCPFCHVDDPSSYFHYALPSILWAHLANLIVIAV